MERADRTRMTADISGTVAQSATLRMNAGDRLWISKGGVVHYTHGVTWELRVPGGAAGAIKRALSGEGMSLIQATSRGDGQSITVAGGSPGKIATWDLSTLGPILTTRGSFLAAWGPDVNITVSIAKRAGAAMFGGVGLVLQRVEGTGTVLVHGSGDFIREELEPGAKRLVSTGNLAALSASIDYDIEAVGSVTKTLFGKEGLFMTRVTGPGVILLQTLKRRDAKGRDE